MNAHTTRFTMLFVLGAATVAACGGDDTGSTTTGAGGGGTTSATTTSVTTSVTTGSSTTNTSTGTGDPMAICDEGRTKLAMCQPGGSGGAGGGGNPVSGDCDMTDQCEAACAIDSSCQQIMFNDSHYADCIYCCNNPQAC